MTVERNVREATKIIVGLLSKYNREFVLEAMHFKPEYD
jgi:hypothetical protein